MSAAPLTAEEVIAQFGLQPHPEGGWYIQTFRDAEGHNGRAHSTAILYLLKTGEVGRWHRVDATEVWHWYGGAPLLLEVKDGETRHEYRLGSDWLKGERPHAAEGLAQPADVQQRHLFLPAQRLAMLGTSPSGNSTMVATSTAPKTIIS